MTNLTHRIQFLLLLLLLLLLIFAFLGSLPVSSQSEKQILLEFKSGVSDDPFHTLSSWDASPNLDHCRNFSGVFCDTRGNVQKIVLHNAGLAGVLSPALAGLGYLQILSVYNNSFAGTIPDQYASIATLRKLNVSRNALTGTVPGFLGNLRNLRLLDLSQNLYTGEVPPALFEDCFRIRFVSFSRNYLSGHVPRTVGNCLRLEGIDLSVNNFSGVFPMGLCSSLSMAYISLRDNSFEGDVVGLLDICPSLEFLDLAGNLFSGSVPFELLGLSNFSFLNASDNAFAGQIPEIRSCSERMAVLHVSGNGVSGVIPPNIANCLSMRSLDLGFNLLNGSIPAEIGNMKSLSVLKLGGNSIQGMIPVELGGIHLLQVLDLHNLRLTGEIPDALGNCRYFLELDVSGNQLEGTIPPNLNNMTFLEVLDLHDNRLNGSIPATIGQLSRMQFLDLSQNFLTGPIPMSLGNLSLLTHLNLSSNNLSEQIPANPIIQQFGSSAFIFNPGLCGPPLVVLCTSTSGGGVESRAGGKLSVSAIVAIVAAAVILSGVCITTIMNIRVRNRKPDETMVVENTPAVSSDSNLIIGKLVLFSKTLPSKYEDWEAGTKALLDKDCLVGGGSIGAVYKTTFEGGVSIAVKKLEILGRVRNKDQLEQVIGRLGNLHHPNLVAFHGYYWSSSMQLILSEFVTNGSLYQHLHEYSYYGSSSGISRSNLHWSRRFRIALGTAKALAYLHHDCKPQVLHLNIKSSNIILDEEFEPKLSDYGLGKLLAIFGNNALTKFQVSVGYVAPELASQGLRLRYGDKCDVYSYGVTLLELVTGRKPVESQASRWTVILCDYVRDLLEKGSASDCFDRRLREFAEIELIQIMKLGLVCTSEAPLKRPSMAEVVQILESIRPNSDSQ